MQNTNIILYFHFNVRQMTKNAIKNTIQHTDNALFTNIRITE